MEGEKEKGRNSEKGQKRERWEGTGKEMGGKDKPAVYAPNLKYSGSVAKFDKQHSTRTSAVLKQNYQN